MFIERACILTNMSLMAAIKLSEKRSWLRVGLKADCERRDSASARVFPLVKDDASKALRPDRSVEFGYS